jgi:hypothetical protein
MMVTFSRTQTLWDQAFRMMKVTNPRYDKVIIMVGLQLAMTLSLSDMRQGIQSTLKQVNGFININDWFANLDSCMAGYLSNLYPVHHNRPMIQSDIAKFLNDSMTDDEDATTMPDFKVVPSSANESTSRTNAFPLAF